MPTSLWRDTTSGLYLLGTIHYLPSSAEIPSQVEPAYSEATMVSVEARPTNQLAQSLGTLPGRATLSVVLSEALYRQLAEAATSVQVDLESSNVLRPVAIATNMLMAAMRSIGWGPGVEARLLERADADRKSVEELEDLNYVTRRIVARGMDTEREYLSLILDALPTLRADQEKLLEAWSNGDISALEKLTALDRYPLVKEVVQKERNRNWLSLLKDYRKSGKRVLVAVGAAHLVGEGNLRELLEARGAKFEQL